MGGVRCVTELQSDVQWDWAYYTKQGKAVVITSSGGDVMFVDLASGNTLHFGQTCFNDVYWHSQDNGPVVALRDNSESMYLYIIDMATWTAQRVTVGGSWILWTAKWILCWRDGDPGHVIDTTSGTSLCVPELSGLVRSPAGLTRVQATDEIIVGELEGEIICPVNPMTGKAIGVQLQDCDVSFMVTSPLSDTIMIGCTDGYVWILYVLSDLLRTRVDASLSPECDYVALYAPSGDTIVIVSDGGGRVVFISDTAIVYLHDVELDCRGISHVDFTDSGRLVCAYVTLRTLKFTLKRGRLLPLRPGASLQDQTGIVLLNTTTRHFHQPQINPAAFHC